MTPLVVIPKLHSLSVFSDTYNKKLRNSIVYGPLNSKHDKPGNFIYFNILKSTYGLLTLLWNLSFLTRSCFPEISSWILNLHKLIVQDSGQFFNWVELFDIISHASIDKPIDASCVKKQNIISFEPLRIQRQFFFNCQNCFGCIDAINENTRFSCHFQGKLTQLRPWVWTQGFCLECHLSSKYGNIVILKS